MDFQEDKQVVDQFLNHVRDGWITYSEKLRAVFGTTYIIDEMALLFPDEVGLARWVKRVVSRDGYHLFNVAMDKVNTHPIPSNYDVSYWFISTPFDYRLELMTIEKGYSPLHSAIDVCPVPEQVVIPMHASFKVPDEEAYASANATLLRNGWECAQKCASTYGTFSYWTEEKFDGWFIKPRVNLRDAS